MKTLVFCTGYATSAAAWDQRHGWWVKALRSSRLAFDQLLIVDDGSPVLPSWPDLTIVREADAPTPERLCSDAAIVLYTHSRRLGRHSTFDFPGWHRSFAFGVAYGAAHGFDKIVHLESDAHLVSHSLQRHIDVFSEGWTALWSAKYTFPEIAVQVAAGSEVATMAAFARRPYAELAGRLHETAFPLTHVELSFVGDRNGENELVVPRHVDYVAQLEPGQPDDCYWWIGGSDAATPGVERQAADGDTVEIAPPFDRQDLEGGWCDAEAGMQWMIDLGSRLFVAPLEQADDCRLRLHVQPCTHPDVTQQQRLYVLLNDRMIGEALLHRATVLEYLVPPGTLSRTRRNCIRFIHPDGFAPIMVGIDDHRQLSVALRKITISGAYPLDQAPPEAAVASEATEITA